MAKATKQAKKKAKKPPESATPYIRRLVEDEHVQKQLRRAAGGLHGAYSRAHGQGGKAAEDKKLYANLRQAAVSIREAAKGLQEPKPKPKRRFQKVAAAALGGGSALLVIKQQRAGSRGRAASGPVDATAGTKASGPSNETEPQTVRTPS